MKKQNHFFSLLIAGIVFMTSYGCSAPKNETLQMESKTINFDVKIKEVPVGENTAKVFLLDNGNGMQVEISSFGGVISKLIVPDKDGNSENIVLGYDQIADYDTNDYYFGSAIGRFGNRIAGGKFEIDGESYQLATNDGDNHLHGGLLGFNRVFWNASYEEGKESMIVKMTYISPDGEEGYPGNLITTLTFELTADNKLLLAFTSETDQPTIVNLTHHGYFNLSAMKEDVLGHQLTLYASKYTPVDENLIPTGELKAVAGTPFDFSSPRLIGERIAQVPGGYDHNYVVKESHSSELVKMATLEHAGSGRVMEVYADSPAVQFYSGNFLDGKVTVNGVTYSQYMGLCLEPQTFPNAPNEPSFPTSRLNPGETYSHKIQYHFSVK
ncbi:aldose epimerase family protein [Mongoliitalea daihaiensis]|uniref:aldose epimerase family protein n=1 Tax=Mongoliitalea daihaiensis TaxID=2782006 RepID=UPI001F303749|nr:aldose epimerase family protein [Mongoliitalea daihaiensis]UJP65087.1 galactose mutarotase [Mongoliitalea daihaiensis]